MNSLFHYFAIWLFLYFAISPFRYFAISVSQVDLNLIHPIEDLPSIAAVFAAHDLQVLSGIRFKLHLVLLQVDDLTIYFGNPDFKVDPDGDDPDDEGAEADRL
jgi:hypothetical protein